MEGASAEQRGNQRLGLDRLRSWEALGYGMFIHFGMATFDGSELSGGDQPSTLYSPDKLDVDQWIAVARDAGMRYAVLTAKHTSGHCLWPSRHTDYHVGTSGNRTDVVAAFVEACERRGLMAGLYYCSWDNHHRFGSVTPGDGAGFKQLDKTKMPVSEVGPVYDAWYQRGFTTARYREFQWLQIEELLTRYGPIGEVWIDIPGLLPRDYRHELYDHIASLQPDALIMMNHGFGDGSEFNVSYAWPTDLIAIERFLPNSQTKHDPWREIEGNIYYLPGEVCEPIGAEWFHVQGDAPRTTGELLGMYLVARARKTNLLLDVPPDRIGLIPHASVEALMRLEKAISSLSVEI